jgi:hypothetical protein
MPKKFNEPIGIDTKPWRLESHKLTPRDIEWIRDHLLKFPSVRATLYSGLDQLNWSDPKTVGYWQGYAAALTAIEKNLYQAGGLEFRPPLEK